MLAPRNFVKTMQKITRYSAGFSIDHDEPEDGVLVLDPQLLADEVHEELAVAQEVADASRHARVSAR